MRSGTRLTLALILGLALAACGGKLPHGLEEVRLSFEGSVTSAVDGAPIQGAMVKFFKTTFGGTRNLGRTFTDAAGRYALTASDTFLCVPDVSSTPLLFEHLEATAASFRSATVNPVCTTATQTIDFALE